VTAYDQPALGCVYKLSALRKPDGAWEHKLKLSDQAAKATNPGILQVRRFRTEREFIGDAIYDELQPPLQPTTIVDPADPTRRKHFTANAQTEDLLMPALKQGKLVAELPSLDAIRDRARQQLAMLHPGIKRFEYPHEYPAGLELRLHDLKTQLILRARGEA
jgi:nicotinate phosphoribosyltransferase